MSWETPLAEQRLKNTTRVVQQSAGLLFLIAAGLTLVLRQTNAVRAGSFWIVAVAVLGVMLSFALRDVIRRLGQRATEEQILKDVRMYMNGNLENAAVVESPTRTEQAQAQAVVPTVVRPGDAFVPCRAAAFLTPKDSARFRGTSEDLVVFDAMPPRFIVEPKMNLYAVLQPVRN